MKQFKPVSLNQAARYKTAVTAFGGVDYATQRFSVDQGHAIDVLNFMRKDGVVQKRKGYEQLFKLNPFQFKDAVSGKVYGTLDWTDDDYIVNGMWRFLAEDGKYHVLAHIGRILYEITNLGKDGMSAEPLSSGRSDGYKLVYLAENYKSSAFVGANILYFLAGNKFMVVRFFNDGGTTRYDYEPVQDMAELYIPTTSIGITYANSGVPSAAKLDSVNLLCKFRYNELVSGAGKGDSIPDKSMAVQNDLYDYTLDAPIVFENESDMDDFLIVIDSLGEVEY